MVARIAEHSMLSRSRRKIFVWVASGFRWRTGCVEDDLQELQIEPSPELVTDIADMPDFLETKPFVQAKTDGVVSGDPRDDDVKVACANFIKNRADERRAETVPVPG